MRRSSIADLLVQANLIGIGTIKQAVVDLIKAIAPSYGGIQTPGPRTVVLGPANAPLAWDMGYAADTPEWQTDAVAGRVSRLDSDSSSRFTLNIDVELPASRQLYATLYKDGMPTLFRASITGRGMGQPVSLTMNAIDRAPLPADYQIYVRCNVTGTTVKFTNGIFLGEAIPARA